MILIVIVAFLETNETNLIRIKLAKYYIRERKHKLERRIMWDRNEFKIYNSDKLIISSYKDIKDMIESDKFLIINYKFKRKNKDNIVIPKEKLYKLNLYDDLKDNVINNIEENKYKKEDVQFIDIENIDIKVKCYGLVALLIIIVIAIIILFFNIFI